MKSLWNISCKQIIFTPRQIIITETHVFQDLKCKASKYIQCVLEILRIHLRLQVRLQILHSLCLSPYARIHNQWSNFHSLLIFRTRHCVILLILCQVHFKTWDRLLFRLIFHLICQLLLHLSQLHTQIRFRISPFHTSLRNLSWVEKRNINRKRKSILGRRPADSG